MKFLLKLGKKINSQICQDFFVLATLKSWENCVDNRYFVEIGAADGIKFSNTYLLEKEFGWNGILVEPSKAWQRNLQENRLCNLEFNCVSDVSGNQMDFVETENPLYSTLQKYEDQDIHFELRKNRSVYSVETISMNDLLAKHKAPNIVDYLSIDTEGSELEILSSLDFSKWQFKVITVEHNFSNRRDKIRDLLLANGYSLVYENRTFMDDWYINLELLRK